MEDLLSKAFDEISSDEVRGILRGGSLDFTKLSDTQEAIKVAMHCCLNGPVGINKPTEFPDSDVIRIKDLYDGRLSNKMWKNFCNLVAGLLKDKHSEIAESSQQFEIHGDIWPLNESLVT